MIKVETLVVGPIEVNCCVIFCDKHLSAIIVDPGDSGKRIIEAVEKMGLKPLMILNTHCHADHVGAVATVKAHFGIPFLCHEDEVQILNDVDQSALAEYLGLKTPPPNDGTVVDGQAIRLCDDCDIRVIHTPGHTPGGICLHGGGILVTGDTLFQGSIGRSDFRGGDLSTLLKSINEKLLCLPDETVVYPGHGDTTTIGDEREQNPFLQHGRSMV